MSNHLGNDKPSDSSAYGDIAPVEQGLPLQSGPSADVPFPEIIDDHEDENDDFHESTSPMQLQGKTLDERKDDILDFLNLHHKRIGNSIRIMWGHKECSLYINKLILAGGDGMGNARVGFNQDAVAAMLELSEVHDTLFGKLAEAAGSERSDFSVRTGYEGKR